MTELEKELIELVFTQWLTPLYKWRKNYNDTVELLLSLNYNQIDYGKIERVFETNENIVGLQQELNNLQKVLKLLKECKRNDK